MAVSVVEDVDSRLAAGVRFLPVASLESGQSSNNMPSRAQWVPCARFVANGEAAWQLMISGNVDSAREVVLEKPGTVSQGDCQAAKAEVIELEARPAYFSVQVTVDAPGWVVLADQWYPGWVGSVNRQPVKIERANFLFRAVPVDAGKNLVEFRFRPISFRIGAVITLGLLSGLLIFGIWSRLR